MQGLLAAAVGTQEMGGLTVRVKVRLRSQVMMGRFWRSLKVGRMTRVASAVLVSSGVSREAVVGWTRDVRLEVLVGGLLWRRHCGVWEKDCAETGSRSVEKEERRVAVAAGKGQQTGSGVVGGGSV